jgi:putative ABC transport system permease protein
MAETLVNEFPEVMQATRLMGAKNVLIRYNDKRFNESRFLYADSTAFEVFTIPLIQGSPQTALTQPNSIVITKTTAKKYFGEEGPMGKTLIMNDWAEYKITGIAEDVPHNSHFHFDFLASLATLEYSRNKTWFSLNLYTYVVLQENYSPAQTEAKFPELIRKYVAPDIHMMMGISVDEFLSSGGNFEFFLQPLLDIHLHSNLLGELEANSDAVYVYIFFVIAIFILVIACINYINLATARSARRAKEVGVRKVLGSLRSQLVKQFLGESVLLSMIAVFLCNSSRRISPSRFQRAYWQENGDQLFRN